MTTQQSENKRKESRGELLNRFVVGRVKTLAEGLHSESSTARTSLAVLRRSLSSPLEYQPQVWSLIFDQFPRELEGPSDRPGVYENAAHIALAFFALHQQSRDNAMHKSGESFGQALQRLSWRSSDSQEKGIVRRFNTVITAQTNDEVIHHMRGLIQQLRAAEIPLDYGQLARDLVSLNYPESARRTRLRWTRDFNRALEKTDVESETDQN